MSLVLIKSLLPGSSVLIHGNDFIAYLFAILVRKVEIIMRLTQVIPVNGMLASFYITMFLVVLHLRNQLVERR